MTTCARYAHNRADEKPISICARLHCVTLAACHSNLSFSLYDNNCLVVVATAACWQYSEFVACAAFTT